ncbi:hypothetical protein J6590_000316 [Homalodisca vitripennis]|nr:hypothetical protein J6590_000316 [Homalodisca vitripennis]
MVCLIAVWWRIKPTNDRVEVVASQQMTRPYKTCKRCKQDRECELNTVVYGYHTLLSPRCGVSYWMEVGQSLKSKVEFYCQGMDQCPESCVELVTGQKLANFWNYRAWISVLSHRRGVSYWTEVGQSMESQSKQREALRSGQASRDLTHSENFVDLTTGAHTQRIESLWAAAKRRNRNEYKYKSQLARLITCMYRQTDELLIDFLTQNPTLPYTKRSPSTEFQVSSLYQSYYYELPYGRTYIWMNNTLLILRSVHDVDVLWKIWGPRTDFGLQRERDDSSYPV